MLVLLHHCPSRSRRRAPRFPISHHGLAREPPAAWESAPQSLSSLSEMEPLLADCWALAFDSDLA